MKLNKNIVAFTGGGTAGHIYPGLAVCDELKQIAGKNSSILNSNNANNLKVFWIGCSKGMDKNIVEKSNSADKFYGIPSGKLRRYFSFKNFIDLFKILGGFISSFFILLKIKPAILFSKGGFVSVPPCLAAKILKIPVFTHECDFTLGLANRINFKSAKNMFVSYEETKQKMNNNPKVVVTGNPVRPVFYSTNKNIGLDFLGIKGEPALPILLVLGGSLGAGQINELVYNNLDWLCEHFIVVHQTGLVNSNSHTEEELKNKYDGKYLPYSFIYEQMPDVLACSSFILCRAGANTLWECAVLNKPMVLVPLCGSGTRGDQVDNARYFEEKGCAQVLLGKNANSKNLTSALTNLLDLEYSNLQKNNIIKLVGNSKPAKTIAKFLYEQINMENK